MKGLAGLGSSQKIKSLLGDWFPMKKCLFFDDTALEN